MGVAILIAVTLAACATAVDPTPQPGNLVVLVNGLPVGAAADVTVTGPSGFSDQVSASETFAGLPPGNYVVSAFAVSHEGVDYTAAASGSPANVAAGSIASVTVTYTPTSTAPGSLTVTISGLPGGVDGDVEVTGPSSFSQTLTATDTLDGLAAGIYEVAAATVDDAGDSYAATVTSSPVTVPAGGSAGVTVAYTLLDPALVGSLQVDITGLPPGTDADVNVSGPGGFDEDVTASTTISDLVPAFYDVTGADVVADGLTYQAVVTTSPTLVLPEETSVVSVHYQPFVPNDGDAESAPGLFVQFRNTAGAPVSVEGLLFNSTSRIDTKGVQLHDSLGDPADPGDWIDIRLVHGQSPTTNISVTLECSAGASPSLIRADLRNEEGDKLGVSTLCNTTKTIAVPNTGGTGNYLMHIVPVFSDPYYTEYTLSINAFCFQSCSYVPYQP